MNALKPGKSIRAVGHDMWVANVTRAINSVPYGTEYCTPRPVCYPYSIPTGLEPKPDSSLRDYERIPLGTNIDQYYQREVKPHLPSSWMDRSKDKTGYEINFTKYFYKYKPLRSVEVFTKDLLELEKESEGLRRGLVDL